MSDRDPSLPGSPVDVPLPPQLAETFGYPGQARYVGLYWTPAVDEVMFEDGRMAGIGASWAFLAYRRHRAVGPLLDRWNLGYSDADAEHCLILDRAASHASVAPLAVARAFLRSQHPPSPELTPERCEALQRRLKEITSQGWQELRGEPEEIWRRMNQQRQAMARMVSWLDQCPWPRGRSPERCR
jgi:hypothetical protein